MSQRGHPDKAHPTWLPIPERPWRLVGPGGTFVQNDLGISLRFESAEEAIQYLTEHDIELWKPWEN